MDLGVMSLDGLVSSDPDQKTKWFNGSGLLKQERSGTCNEDELLRTFKLAKTDQNQRNSCTSSSPNSSLLRSNVTTPSGSSKQINVAASPSSFIVVPGSNNATNTLSFAHQEHSKNMNSLIGQDNASSAANTINRMFMNSKEHKSYSRVSRFSTAWLGVDQTA